ncbi:hypothetical protein CAF53_18485 [Sphingobium sp. LB126]|uniref:response regulator transcription factor n=1 Tax=Sphingobium sp. LB126 TaxID=1983755 RepID=UPI000C203ACC|nr:response regulator [Sphingobium sp. LB126]PJG46194.1 hypothetical protein CAF53_18485 [Sphingobium sp. LB126]
MSRLHCNWGGASRRHLVSMLRSHGHVPTPFSTGTDFLEASHFLHPGIAVLDVHLPDMPGLLTLQELLSRRRDIPIIMTSTGADIRVAVQTIKKGADDFVEQPVDDQILLETIDNTALLLEERIDLQKEKIRVEIFLDRLSKREFDVLKELANHDDNYSVAKKLNLTVRSIETYRSRIMRKCGTSKFADAVSMCRGYIS